MKRGSFVLVALVLVAARAEARDDAANDAELSRGRRAVGDAALFFRGATSRSTQTLSLAMDARATLTAVGHRLGPAIAADWELGLARPVGFAYGVHLHPLGLGVALGTHGSIVVSGGAGFGGVTGELPFDLELPVAARLALDLTDRVRLHVDARAMWTPDARDGNRAALGDETRIGLGARFGRTWHEHRMVDAGGYFFRLERSERLGATFLGATLGYELGGAF